jgi:hypothetical protein
MILDLNKYKAFRNHVHRFLDLNPERRTVVNIEKLAVACHCPILAAYYFMKEKVGETEELRQCIEKTKEFYQYSDIVMYMEDEK